LDVARLHSGPALILERGDAQLVEIKHQVPGVLDGLVLRDLPELGAQETDRGTAVQRAGQLALVVLLDLDPGRIGRGRLDTHRLERRGVGVDTEVEQLERHRVARRNAIELRPAEAARFVDELLFRPAPEHDHPFARLGFGHLVLDQLDGFLVRRYPVESDFTMPILRGAHVMRVVVDKPWDDGAASEGQHARTRPLVLLDRGVAADREDALALDRQRLGNREPVVHGDDLAVQQHDIGGRLRQCSFAAGDDGSSNESGTDDGTHDGLPDAIAYGSIMPQTRSKWKRALPMMDFCPAGGAALCAPASDTLAPPPRRRT